MIEKKSEEIVRGYCCKCKKKQEFKAETEEIKEIGKRKFLIGLCATCGTKMSRILPKLS